MPPGSDDWSCRPTAAHPYPVILVHGTLANENFSWQALSPMLADAGYCVFAFNYGETGATHNHLYGLADIAASAGQLAAFVDQVRSATGAAQVDLVGHSQGGMMPRYYLQFLGGAPYVHLLVGLAPSNDGTTVEGMNLLLAEFAALTGRQVPTMAGCPACTEQIDPSPFLQALNAGGGLSPSVRYVVIETEDDEVVTPYYHAFLGPAPNVRNIVLQQQCPGDATDHLGIIYDPVALQDVMDALGSDTPTYHPVCSVVPPVTGG